MENTSHILKELQDISPLLAGANKENVYSISPTYFHNLASEILSKIESLQEPTFNFSSVTPYKVSEGYFENFSDRVLKRIKSSQNLDSEIAEELNEVAPLLNTINKTPIYTVPAGYLENLRVLPHVSSRRQAKVIHFSKKVVRYAAAAAITGVVAVSSYFIIQKDSDASKAQGVNVTSAVRDLKDEEIIDFLKTSSGSTTTNFSDKLAPTREIKQQLKEMSDDELQQYLKENSEPGEIEVDI